MAKDESLIKDFVDDYETILTDLSTYTTHKALTIHKMARKMPEIYPQCLILPESTTVIGQEAGGEVLESTITLFVTVRVPRVTLHQEIYEYEWAMRRAVWANRGLNTKHYWLTVAEYGLEHEVGSVRVRDLIITAMAKGQYVY